MSVYLLDGKAVLVDGKVATSEDCCCVKGACCQGTECSYITEEECNNAGGIYQGDGVPCDPNPCATCPCYYEGFLGVGFYLKKRHVKTYELVCRCCRPDQCGSPSCHGEWIREWEIDPVTCVETLVFESGAEFHCTNCAYSDECIADPVHCDGGDCTGFESTGMMAFVFDVPVLTIDSDSHKSGSYGWNVNLQCDTPPFGDCDTVDVGGGGTDYLVTEEVTLSVPCTPV